MFTMRYVAGFAAVCCLPLADSLLLAETRPSEESNVLSMVNAAEIRREADIRQMVSTRRYTLRNKRWDREAVMHVRITSQPKKGKQFEIVSMENVEGLQKKIFLKLLEAEVEASKNVSHEAESALTAANYDFDVVGSEIWKGRECTVLQLKPKRNSKYLIAGKAWVDTKEHAIVRVEGQTARNVSFWIGKPHVTQEFRKTDDVWVSAANRSVSDVKLLGRTELMIDFVAYEITRERSFARAHVTRGGL
jgi:hypothetical protein